MFLAAFAKAKHSLNLITFLLHKILKNVPRKRVQRYAHLFLANKLFFKIIQSILQSIDLLILTSENILFLIIEIEESVTFQFQKILFRRRKMRIHKQKSEFLLKML